MGNKTKIFTIYLISLFLIIAFSCNPILKAERKVLNNVESSERVFRELEKTRPCANDTSFITLLDTLVTSDTITNYKTDTINNVLTLKEIGKTIYKTKKVIEIKTGYIVDTRRLGIMADSVRFYKTSLQDSINTSKKWRLRFLGLLGILIGYYLIKRFLWSYLNILH
jgi:hypothetical protein